MDLIPVEVWEVILGSPKLSIEDVLNFGTTCIHFCDIVKNSQYIWKQKFRTKWPELTYLLVNGVVDWVKEVQHIYNLKKEINLKLANMSVEFYKKNELSDCDLTDWIDLTKKYTKLMLSEKTFECMESDPCFDELLECSDEFARAHHYIVYHLMNIVNTNVAIKSVNVVPINTPGNKTLQYYALKALRHLRQFALTKEWKAFIALPEKKQLLENGAMIVAQWCQPDVNINYGALSQQLDAIANNIIVYTKEFYPKHPLNKVSNETLKEWRENKLEHNAWNALECRQLIQGSMVEVFYKQNYFIGDRSENNLVESSLINKVLVKKIGVQISLAIIYDAIARRVGLRCDPVCLPSHFLLRFTEGYDEPEADSYYIDLMNNGSVLRKYNCPYSRHNSINNEKCPSASSQQVIQCMVLNLEYACRQQANPNESITFLRSILELLLVVSPYCNATIDNLAHLYLSHDIDLTPIKLYFESVKNSQCSDPEWIQNSRVRLNHIEVLIERNNLSKNKSSYVECKKSRPSKVSFAVGMVMKHFVLNYVCVIYDWDTSCKASVQWQLQMGVHKLRHKEDQPFYNVIVADGTLRYAAQENLIPYANPSSLNANQLLGKYFSHFFETHFVPNAQKEDEYPSDAEVRHKFYLDMKFGNGAS